MDKPERTNRSEDARRQVLVERGRHCEVKKHSSMGCAVVTLSDARVRQAILNALGQETTIANIKVKLKPHFDKETDKEVLTDLFVGWGRQIEKTTPLAEVEIAKFFDQLHAQMLATGRLEDLARAPHNPAGVQVAGRPAAVPAPTMQQTALGASVSSPPTPPAMPQQPQAYNQQFVAHQAQAQYAASMQHYQYLMMYQQQQQQAMAYYHHAAHL